MKFFKGIIHVHSNYSSDGHHSLIEIAEWGKKKGYSFIGMSEHSSTFDKQKMVDYIAECKKISNSELLMIPGIEFSCSNGLHIIGLGIKDFISSCEAVEITESIQKQNGLAIITHPVRYKYQIPLNLVRYIDGIEIWNSMYDGRFVPDIRTIDLFRRIKKDSTIFAYGGIDLHRISNNCNIETIVFCNELEDVLNAMKKGNFIIANPYITIDSACNFGWFRYVEFFMLRKIYLFARWIRDQIKDL